MAAAVATALSVEADTVLTASTGGIGIRLPAERIAAAAPALVAALGDDVAGAARGDPDHRLRTKLAFREIDVGGKRVRFAAIAKGSGMIHPQMATMLCFIATDAQVAPAAAAAALANAVEETLQHHHRRRRHVDQRRGDRAGQRRVGRRHRRRTARGSQKLEAALLGICADLARAIAADGEGATKLLVVDVAGVPDARDGARPGAGGRRAAAWSSRASSAAIRRGGGSWPRWAPASARAATPIDPANVTLDIQGTRVYENGGPVAFDKADLSARMTEGRDRRAPGSGRRARVGARARAAT